MSVYVRLGLLHFSEITHTQYPETVVCQKLHLLKEGCFTGIAPRVMKIRNTVIEYDRRGVCSAGGEFNGFLKICLVFFCDHKAW